MVVKGFIILKGEMWQLGVCTLKVDDIQTELLMMKRDKIKKKVGIFKRKKKGFKVFLFFFSFGWILIKDEMVCRF